MYLYLPNSSVRQILVLSIGRLIFTDEKSFPTTEANIRHVWRRANTRYDEKNIQEIKRSGQTSISFHGWMWAGGLGDLTKIDGHLNGEKYINILEHYCHPSVPMQFHHQTLLDLCMIAHQFIQVV